MVKSGVETAYSNIIRIIVATPGLPPTDRNYVLTRTMQDEHGTAYSDKLDYFDGIGRPVQTVFRAASPARHDLVGFQEYDLAGRKSHAWLSAPVSGGGAYVEPGALKAASISFHADSAPYVTPVYEASPLNRISEQCGAGEAWRNALRSVKTAHLSNESTGALSCARYVVLPNHSLRRVGIYDPGTLFVSRFTDEDGNVSHTFTDKSERVVLIRRMSDGEPHDTYFVHDDLGNLRYVLPPQASDLLTEMASWSMDNSPVLQSSVYYYEYDDRKNRILEKHPARFPIRLCYDRANRLVFRRDGNQQQRGEWNFFLYDGLGRPTVSGICKSDAIPAVSDMVIKSSHTGDESLGGYSANLTLTNPELLTVNYYDDYSFMESLSAGEKTELSFVSLSGYGSLYPNAKGLLTGMRTYRLGDASRCTVLSNYYDDRGRLVQKRATNHLGGFDSEFFSYTFTGKTQRRLHVHSVPGSPVQTELYTYTYDHAERLLTVTHRLNENPPVTLAEHTYDGVGRLASTTLGNGSQELRSYNVRGWLTEIESPCFTQRLHYTDGPGTPCHNGNVSSMTWQTPGSPRRGYRFSYDGLNRLTAAAYGEGDDLAAHPDRFTERVTGYDRQGNILGLKRHGQTSPTGYGLIDDLTLTYKGNQLQRVQDGIPAVAASGNMEFKDGADAEVEYRYDADGNLTKDLNKKLAGIEYNSLNLPCKVRFDNGDSITYLYDAGGTKLRTTHVTGGVTVTRDYLGNALYENGSLVKLLTEQGCVTLPDGRHHYRHTDHQGNIRAVTDQSGQVEEVNHYYPFGGLFSSASNVQPYKYNGKELDRVGGLDWYDYGARMYDASLGRWHAVDPLAEKYAEVSPYVYCKNNPVNRLDPDGKDDYAVNSRGRLFYIGNPDNKKDKLYLFSGNPHSPRGKEFITAKKGLLTQMYTIQQKEGKGYFSYGSTQDLESAVNIFKFVADNTNVEWRFDVYSSNDKFTAILSTDQQEARVGNGDSVKRKLDVLGKKIIDIHSHPSKTGTKGGFGNDLKLANPMWKNFVYFKGNSTLYEYNNRESNIKETVVLKKEDFMQFIESLLKR